MAITPIWPNLRYDVTASGNCPYDIYGFDIHSINTISGAILGPPVLAYSDVLETEIIYIPYTTNNKIIKVRALQTDGTLVWEKTLWDYTAAPWDLLTYSKVYLTLSTNASKLYCCHAASPISYSASKTIYCLNSQTGTEIWYFDASYYPRTPIVEHDDKIYFATAWYPGFPQIYMSALSDNGLSASVLYDSLLRGTNIPGINHEVIFAPSIVHSNDYTYCAYFDSDSIYTKYYTDCAKVFDDGTVNIIQISELPAGGGITTNKVICYGLLYDENYYSGSNPIFITSDYGLIRVNTLTEAVWIQNTSMSSCSEPVFDSANGTIYYRAGSTLYAINGGSTYSLKWSNNAILPNSSISPVLYTSGGTKQIIVASSNTSGNNLHVFKDDTTHVDLIEAHSVQNSATRYIAYTPIVGDLHDTNAYYYAPYTDTASGTIGKIIVLHSSTPVTTTTTTSSTTSTTTTPTTTTTTTTLIPLATTTTTTTPAPLAEVSTEPYAIIDGNIYALDPSSGSDDPRTEKTPFSKSLSFGTIAPGENSRTIVVSLNVPYAQAIANIKLGLTDTGGITFATTIFGYTVSSELKASTNIDNYFQGVNTDNLNTNTHNISIPNQTNQKSNYVYLRVSLPEYQAIETGMIRFSWWFDYSD